MSEAFAPSVANPVVELTNVSLCYRLAKQRIPSLKEYAIHWLKGALSYEKLWALSKIDLTIRRGESIGIVGRNGAGKSTLLKVISRVLVPTEGQARLRGVVAPILELGTGFDHELTGRENIYLNALLLGRSKREIDRVVDQIAAFSGLGDFIHSPVRNYSSGMLARLGFSIATAWPLDLLILDEVFSVGDSQFIHRSEERLREMRREGATMLLVSHFPESIRTNCERCLWLEKGRLMGDGPAEEVLAAYQEFMSRDELAS
ncbi:MAG: ABC transporter ATP-binding protein [Thermoanaerobaculia bacterium]|nr:ABC transporter ATP-binding protein [Thermoanaerobaculia bacterium]